MLHIPQEKLPQEFQDEARLDSLYSPFRSRTVNPRDWDTKIASWRQILSLYCANNGVYSFTLHQLNKTFLRHGRPPSCLGVVLEELVKSGDLQYLDVYLQTSPKSWSGWATNLVKKPISWSYNTVKRSLFSQNNTERSYVHVGVIREESQKVLATTSRKHNKVINFPEFLKLIGKDLSQSDDVKLLLHYLIQEQKADIKSLKNDDLESLLVKIAQKDKVPEISDREVSIYVLEQNERLFTKHVEDLEDEITRCVKEIKSHLLRGHRQLAKTCLKKKHEIEKRLTHKANALHNIQVLLERVKDVHGDADVWNSYKEALAAFNSTVKQTGLTEDAVEDTMLKLGEMLDIHDDIQAAISKPVLPEDEDLEEELADLMKVEETPVSDTTDIDEDLAKLDINDLPIVPSSNVSLQEAS